MMYSTALKSSILRVVHHHEQRAGGEGVVTREILQEAVEQISVPLGELLGEALRLQSEGLWIKDGRRSVDLEELLRVLQERSGFSPYHDTTSPNAGEAQLQGMDIEHMFLKELKEFSDGELTISFTTMM
ncbi:protein prune homolog 2-like [Salvelinus fontinalis]|uniref:protein prune homolog 2-like n=1 Tax=Salvelinus fontinalis TaxID=8038 RepID=UPI002485A234|nr:protein prune homolog 2-like [Salvelinus fontinalis]XP_055774973.1 protein prune homolog 2-like [Salvelinus fontinalis]XP_055774974.1 protein prune homolog 2-like [Salvelinus fontinalis]